MILLALTAAVGLVALTIHVDRALAEIRRYRDEWVQLAETQEKHEVDIRYVRELVNPMARRGRAPMPRHLQVLRQEKQA